MFVCLHFLTALIGTVLQITLTDTLSFYYLSFDIRVFRLEVFGLLYFLISVNFFMSFFSSLFKGLSQKGKVFDSFLSGLTGMILFYGPKFNIIGPNRLMS